MQPHVLISYVTFGHVSPFDRTVCLTECGVVPLYYRWRAREPEHDPEHDPCVAPHSPILIPLSFSFFFFLHGCCLDIYARMPSRWKTPGQYKTIHFRGGQWCLSPHPHVLPACRQSEINLNSSSRAELEVHRVEPPCLCSPLAADVVSLPACLGLKLPRCMPTTLLLTCLKVFPLVACHCVC